MGTADSAVLRAPRPVRVRWARAADPDVLLFYNEVGIERVGPKSDFTYEKIRDLLAKGVPIDGIGFQSHISIHCYPAESNLRANIRRFADLGLKVNISELDARPLLLPGTRDSRWQAQRQPRAPRPLPRSHRARGAPSPRRPS
jgi:endo-1,4-beta-xylanase